tara:strand:+ start:52 stop:1176 length:1125 start_codon:yes stop_codon:yes gene_type:complete
MAQTIKIKRTTGTGKDSAVEQGELFYAYGSGGTYGKRLAIGHVNGGGNTPEIIGGSLFMDMLDHTKGTVTADSAIIVDDNSKIDSLKIGNSNNAGGIELYEGSSNGTNHIKIVAPTAITSDTTLTLPDGAGSNGQVLSTNGSGTLSWTTIASSFTLAADSGSNDTFNTGETLTFTGTANEIETTVSNNTITIGLPTNVTISGNLTVSGTTTTVSSTTVNVADSMLSLATGNNSSDAVDIGFYGLYDDSGSQDEYAGLFRDAGDQKWKLFKNLQAEPGTTVNTSGTGYAVATLVAHLEDSSVSITGGSITGITDLAVADGGTGLSAVAKGSILAANTANVLTAVDGGGSTDKFLLYTASSDTISWTNAVDGGTYS